MKTVIMKADISKRKWYLVDATDQVLGRLASQVAACLRGKHKPEYSPHLDYGDHIVVINADKLKVTGKKEEKKFYTRYTGYPGGLRTVFLQNLKHDKPEKVLYHAVKGMLPKNRLGRKMIRKLKIYTGPEHPHQAQKCEALPENLRKA